MNALLIVTALALADASGQHHEHGEKIGTVTFPTSCSPAAQATFLRGVAWLHSFEYGPAEATFNQAAASDPSCAMAHWGAAMSLYHPLWAPPTAAELERGRAAVAKAMAVPAKTERERDYVAAIAAFYRNSDKLDHKTRAMAYNAAMEALYKRYPEDREAAVFYALSQAAAGTLDNDPTFAREKDAAAILAKVLKEEPDHPGVAHYLIHSFDYPPLAELAVPAARRYASIAPDSPHAQHMPSHIFTRLGMWDDSIASNLKSAASAQVLMKKAGFDGASREELHAMDYLTYAYLQTGRYKEAEGVRAHLHAMQKVDEPIFSVAFAATAIPARLVLERKRWTEAAHLELPPNVRALAPLDNFRWGEAHIRFARAMGAARSGDASAARLEIAGLNEIEQEMKVPPGTYDWKTQVSIERQIAQAWLARAEHHDDEAVQLLRAAADLDDATEKHPVTPGAILPAREQLGELLLELGRPAEALIQYEASLKRAPLRLASVRGAARAAKLAGNAAQARLHEDQLLALTKHADAQSAGR
jgi:tetratricopeptide (TPR) repeat protein